MNNLQSGLLAALLTLSAYGVNAQDAKDKSDPEFQFTLKSGARTVNIPVNCDALDDEGNITAEFVKQMGVWGHLENVDKQITRREAETGMSVPDDERLNLYLKHLKAHGLMPEKIKAAAKHCRENFPHEP